MFYICGIEYTSKASDSAILISIIIPTSIQVRQYLKVAKLFKLKSKY